MHVKMKKIFVHQIVFCNVYIHRNFNISINSLRIFKSA